MGIELLLTVWVICIIVIVISYSALFYYMKRVSSKAIVAAKKNSNPIVALGPVGMDTYLESIFLMILQLEVSAYGTDKDPDIKVEIYTRTLTSFLVYLGIDIINAINDAYGNNYILRWFDARYKTYELRGELDRVLANPPYANTALNYDNLEKMHIVLSDLANKAKKGSK